MMKKSIPVRVRLGPQHGLLSPDETATKARNEKCYSLDTVGFAVLHAGHPREAESYARQVLSLSQNTDLLAQELLASALKAQEKTQEALHAYKTLADQGGAFPRNIVSYASLLLKSGQWSQAVIAYNSLLPYLLEGDLLRSSFTFLVALPKEKEMELALHIAQGLIHIGDPGWGGSLPNKNEGAMNEFSKALNVAPYHPLSNYYYGYGWQHLSITERAKYGDAQQAKAALEKAVKLGKPDVKEAAQKALLVAAKP